MRDTPRAVQILLKRPMIRVALVILILSSLIISHLQITLSRLGDASSNLKVITQEAWPPDFSVLTDRASWAYPPCDLQTDWMCSPAVVGMTQTLEIAFLATVLGMILSLPLAAAAATNLAPPLVAQSIRQLLAALRVLPSLIWALIFVILVGIGPLAGVLAMTMYSVGYLGKLQYEALEGVSREPLEVARTMGLPRWQVARFFAIPEAANSLLSQMLFMFEYNVRHGSVVGLVGAGGIGWYMQYYLEPFKLYDRVLALIIVMYIVVIAIDQVSLRVRSRFIDDEPMRPKWKQVFLPWSDD
ncbi:MAG: ABC transporter permease subunit [Candidatus Thermoplasmatota archaeon]|nr:ABC transporter permease subunit [Candidatus Thermoplasmatota archaeon]MEC9001281.1 ABC transporter permease subunit [Candidatus Thermoplasmatota archaeon]MEE3315488.1 ABC transporter permease subunit [Candidatus Thermoplasmatota archaeon]|tara:strand:- start:1595 stop:2494 length:900 start_codon:yes stop_codon:yes gene_type:complete